MQNGDFLLYTVEVDTASPRDSFVAEITSIDKANSFFSCRELTSGQQLTFQFSSNTTEAWSGSDDAGKDWIIDSHDIYTPGASDPTEGGVALITFGDNSRYLVYVESITPQLDVVCYSKPYCRLSLELTTITKSDWEAYTVGTEIISIEAYVLDNEIGPSTTSGSFINGWWSLARRMPAFAGRIGGTIAPFATVVHTTDMAPETWDALLHSWTTRLGPGDCAHFILGRASTDGVVQLAPVTNNANHAGGPGHGSFVAGAQSWHPNNVSVGIEIHCAGAVRQIAGAWRLVEAGAPHGAAIPDEDVIPDEQHEGRGWHKVTDYQYEQLGALLDGLETVLGALPAGCVAQSVEQPPQYARFATGRIVGHVSLHAAARGDPWPPTCDWIRSRA